MFKLTIVLTDHGPLNAGARQLLSYQDPHYLIARIVEAVGNTRRDENQVSTGNLNVFLPNRLLP